MHSARTEDVVDRYTAFARDEVRGRNPVFASWSTGIAADPATVRLIESLPVMRRQPVLVFAAARHVGAPDTEDYGAFRDFFHAHWDEIAELCRTHSTQTNEAARCGVLLPLLARLPGPLSLVEAGTSAGLCLYPDRYSYRFSVDGRHEPVALDGPSGGPVLDCALRDGVPAPTSLPEVVHRGGVDLNPLDASDADDRAWLHSLVWPGHDARLARLDQALDVAAADPPEVLRGDLVERIGEAVDACPTGSTPVVFHTAVLAYLDPDRRAEFVRRVRELDCVWISVEGVTILPEVAERVPESIRRHRGIFVVSVDGVPLATAQGHGEWIRALDVD